MESSGDVLEVPHAASPGGLSPLGFGRPIIYGFGYVSLSSRVEKDSVVGPGLPWLLYGIMQWQLLIPNPTTHLRFP